MKDMKTRTIEVNSKKMKTIDMRSVNVDRIVGMIKDTNMARIGVDPWTPADYEKLEETLMKRI